MTDRGMYEVLFLPFLLYHRKLATLNKRVFPVCHLEPSC